MDMVWLLLELQKSSITVALIAILGFIAKGWFSTRIKESVSSEYKEALEEFKKSLDRQEDRRKQAFELADFFSIYMKMNYFPNEDLNSIRYDIQKKYWQLVLTLDAPVLKAVNEFLNESSATEAHKEALIVVRKLYMSESDDLQACELFHFDPLPDFTLNRVAEGL